MLTKTLSRGSWEGTWHFTIALYQFDELVFPFGPFVHDAAGLQAYLCYLWKALMSETDSATQTCHSKIQRFLKHCRRRASKVMERDDILQIKFEHRS
jgi:hypothetical protein